jgi:HKD family nuclease
MIETLQRGWSKNLNAVFQSAEAELTISSPYISNVGADFLIKNVSENFKKKGTLRFVTDLSPKCIYQGSTDPNSFKLFFDTINSIEIFHLPRLHAKVYVSDKSKAIITSGNLTAGGIYNNFEYGVFTQQKEKVSIIRNDLLNYANLGATINSSEIDNYCDIAEELKKLYQQREKSAKVEI